MIDRDNLACELILKMEWERSPAVMARQAYELADAMIAESETGPVLSMPDQMLLVAILRRTQRIAHKLVVLDAKTQVQ